MNSQDETASPGLSLENRGGGGPEGKGFRPLGALSTPPTAAIDTLLSYPHLSAQPAEAYGGSYYWLPLHDLLADAKVSFEALSVLVDAHNERVLARAKRREWMQALRGTFLLWVLIVVVYVVARALL